jgi:hypothetical protein
MIAPAAAVFLGAFLLFQVQLIIAKAILPWFGGVPAVWTTCMLFFQALLLGGYAYAHASASVLRPRTQGAVHLMLVVLALSALPILPGASSTPGGTDSPVAAIILLLLCSVGLPYFVLAASGPLIQHWFAAANPGASPYRLYALSNAGSLLGLVSYPFAVEPWLTTRAQAWIWSAAFAGFAVLCALSLRGTWRANACVAAPSAATAPGVASASAPRLAQKLRWLALAATASTLLLAVTNQMCQEVAVVPLLWVLPLALYLLSFVLCFESPRWYSRSWCLPVLIPALIVLAQAAALEARVGVYYGVPIFSLGLFVACMFCHGELAARRPASAYLTSYYLMIALGGVLGGAFTALAAPRLFRGFDEMYVGLFACGALAAAFLFRSRAERRALNAALPVLVTVVILIGAMFGMRMATRALPGSSERRNFFGVLRVQDLPAPDGKGAMRYLTHGGTRHGQQYLDAARRGEPTAYFGRESGIGLLCAELADGTPRRVGIIGLGAGVIAAHGRAGDTFRFYEINPLVIEVARRDFTFLADAPARVEVVEGDARLALEREDPQRYDALVLDAFSSDAIPMHLLTVEAFTLYVRHLAPGGVLALHLTTRHLDLGPVIAGIAGALALETWEIATPADDARALLGARWILAAPDRALFLRPRIASAGHALALGGKTPLVFTDDFSNLFAVLK